MSQAPKEEQQGGGGGFSIWGFGSSVLENVTQNATSFVNTIVETDWNKELQEIQEGIKEETQTLEHEVEKKLGINKGPGAASTSRAAGGQQSDAPGMITEFGRRLVHGTAEIFQQVRQQVDAEFTNLEQEAAKKPRSTFPKRTGTGKFSRIDFQMTQLQRNGATYCDEPAEKELYAAFLEAYDEEAHQAEAEEILASNPFMADLHSRLVPLVISDDTFWQRYFFRVQLLKSEHEKRGQRLRRAHHLAGSEAGELPLDEPFEELDGGSPTATPPTDTAAADSPAGDSAPAKPPSPTDADATAAPAPAAVLPTSSATDSATDGPQGSAVGKDPAEPESTGEESGMQASSSKPLVAAEASAAADLSSGTAVHEAPAAASTSDSGTHADAEVGVPGPDGLFPEQPSKDAKGPVAPAEAASPSADTGKIADLAPAAGPSAGASKELHAGAESPLAGDEHACGSSAGGSVARSPQSSGNVMSSEWSIVSGPHAPSAAGGATQGHANGSFREPVPAVEEGEEGSEDIDVQEEDVNFDDLDSLGGDANGDGNDDDDEEEIDENWGQWE